MCCRTAGVLQILPMPDASQPSGTPVSLGAFPCIRNLPRLTTTSCRRGAPGRRLISGLFNLARVDGDIEIRVVVQRANYERLPELAYFIFRNLTFARHVAFMGIEPIGFAPANRDSLWIDPADCAGPLKEATFFLANRGMDVSMYNFPLCSLPGELWELRPEEHFRLEEHLSSGVRAVPRAGRVLRVLPDDRLAVARPHGSTDKRHRSFGGRQFKRGDSWVQGWTARTSDGAGGSPSRQERSRQRPPEHAVLSIRMRLNQQVRL